MSYTSDLYVLYDAEQDAATVKSMPQDLEDDKNLWPQYAYDPYEKDEQVATYEKMAGVKIALNKSTESVNVGANKTLIALVSPKSAGSPVGASNNEAVATVNQSGKVVGVKAGTAKISATINGRKAECTVTVS